MFNYKMTLVINTLLTMAMLIFINLIGENPSLLNIGVLMLITFMQTTLFFGEKND